MRTNENIFGDFIKHIDAATTIHGGVSMTQVDKEVHDWGLELSFQTPGLDPSAYRVEIQGHGLAVYAILPQHSERVTEEEQSIVPSFFRKFPLSYRTDIQNIEAKVKGKRLHVRIPNREDLPERMSIDIE